jgi:hypothetical protein
MSDTTETQVGPGFDHDDTTPDVDPTPTFDPGSMSAPATPDSPALLNVFRRFGDFHRLGQGGAGTVDSVSDPHLGRRVTFPGRSAESPRACSSGKRGSRSSELPEPSILDMPALQA